MVTKLYTFGMIFVCLMSLLFSIMAATMDICKVSFMKANPFCIVKNLF